MKFFSFNWHSNAPFEPTKTTQEGSQSNIPLDSPPSAECEELDPSWASIVVDSKLFGEQIILCKKDFYKACRRDNPGKAVYIYPEEWQSLERLCPESLKLIHLLKRETDGFVLGPDHPEVKALEARNWFSAWERKPPARPGYLHSYGESQTLRDSWSEQLRREKQGG